MRMLVGLFLYLFVINAQAISLPKDFYYLGKPIDALCFFEGDKNPVSLKTCGIQAEKDRKIGRNNAYLTKKGYTGYDYTWPLSAAIDNCSSYYKVIDKIQDRYLILTFNNSGGTGNFTDVLWVKRQNDQLFLEHILGGDRCNGGISDAYRQDGAVIIEQNLTAYDFVASAKNAKKLTAYDDLASCAICCSATVAYKINPSNPKKLETYRYELSESAMDSDQGKYQSCFYKLVKEYQKQGKRFLNQVELEAFVNMFNKTCSVNQSANQNK